MAATPLLGVGALAVGERVRRRVHVETYMGWLRKFLWAMVVLLIFQFVSVM